MDGDGAPIEASNWGAGYRTQGILAPGQNILGASTSGGVSTRTGTSFATPLVSGLAALLLSVQIGRGEKPDPHAVRRALLKSATPCPSREDTARGRCLAGAVNPAGALAIVQSGGTDMQTDNVIGAAEAPSPLPGGALPADAIRNAEAAPPPFIEPRGEAGVTASELAPQNSEVSSTMSVAGVAASDCGCGCGGAKAAPDAAAAKTCACAGTTAPTLVYALGKLHYDFQTEARRDRFIQFMPADPRAPSAPANPYDPEQIARYLAEHPHEAEALTWTLNLDATPIYAIVGAGPFASVVYDKLRDCFSAELNEGAQLISIAGTIAGSVRLYSGQVVPLVIAARQGIFCWSTQPLAAQVLGVRPEAQEQRALYDRRLAGLNNFLDRVYYDLRNLGVAPQDRALNYAATNAFQIGQVMETAARGDLELDTIKVHKSPVCRPDSDCYDVEVSFYNPQNVLVANRVYRFTIDVSDVIPVTIGDVRSWSKRS
jgi:cyanobactin maturation PatA/PatG family protease